MILIIITILKTAVNVNSKVLWTLRIMVKVNVQQQI